MSPDIHIIVRGLCLCALWLVGGGERGGATGSLLPISHYIALWIKKKNIQLFLEFSLNDVKFSNPTNVNRGDDEKIFRVGNLEVAGPAAAARVNHPSDLHFTVFLQSFPNVKMWNRYVSVLFVMLSFTLNSIVGRPTASDPSAVKVLSKVASIPDSDLIGASNIDTLLSQMYNDIIKTRLENLLQGVAGTQKQSKTADIAASISNIEAASLTGSASLQRTAEYAETYLQSPVTAIPLSILTSLPGSSTYNISTQ